MGFLRGETSFDVQTYGEWFSHHVLVSSWRSQPVRVSPLHYPHPYYDVWN